MWRPWFYSAHETKSHADTGDTIGDTRSQAIR